MVYPQNIDRQAVSKSELGNALSEYCVPRNVIDTFTLLTAVLFGLVFPLPRSAETELSVIKT